MSVPTKRICVNWLAIITGLTASLSLLTLAGIFLFLLITGSQALMQISWSQWLGTLWNPTSYHQASWGIISLILGTVIICVLSMSLSWPLGLAAALHLSESAGWREREVVKTAIEMVVAVPSVVIGLLGLQFLAPIISRLLGISSGLNGLTASLLVAVVTFPIIASLSEDALQRIPLRLREASLALGATKSETIWRTVLPAARPGLAAAAMLGLGRAIGETMIVLMVAGNSRSLPRSILDPISPLTATIAIDIKEVVLGSLHWHSLFALGLLLFLITLAVNASVDRLLNRRWR